ncbi:hypothetical protein ABT297_39740 [Dactylosporangium sp. NPDC000555]|uniref:hypothetical protein n=1 Tax=Dactylosporangium sp. NPDC000555 TaxID=3154260 RepID=UPI00331767CE
MLAKTRLPVDLRSTSLVHGLGHGDLASAGIPDAELSASALNEAPISVVIKSRWMISL